MTIRPNRYWTLGLIGIVGVLNLPRAAKAGPTKATTAKSQPAAVAYHPREDPRLGLRWLPQAPTGEEQAAIPEQAVAPEAPRRPAKAAKAELWDTYRKAQAAYQEQRSAWRRARKERAMLQKTVGLARASRLSNNAALKAGMAGLVRKSARLWPFGSEKTATELGGCDGSLGCLSTAGRQAKANFLLVLSRPPARKSARLLLVDIIDGELVNEADVALLGGAGKVRSRGRGPRLKLDARGLEKAARGLLELARQRALARLRTILNPMIEGHAWGPAALLLSRGLKLDAKAADLRLAAAQAAFETGELKVARAHLSRAVKDPTTSARALALLGQVALRQNRAAEAALHFARAIEGGEDSFEARISVARSRIRKDPAAALTHLEAALELRPEDGEANLLLGRLLIKKGQPAAATSHLQKALAAGLAPGEMHLQLGLLALAAKDKASALTHLEAAHAAGQATAASLFAHAQMLAASAPARAAELYVKARRKGSKEASLDLVLGKAALAAGQQRLAEQALLRATHSAKDQGEAHLLLAGLYSGEQDAVAAAKHFDAAASGGHDSYEGRLVLAKGALAAGDLKAARGHLEAASKKKEAASKAKSSELHFLLGRTLFRLGDKVAAKGELKAALAEGLHPAGTEFMLGELSEGAEALAHYQAAIRAGSTQPRALRAAARAAQASKGALGASASAPSTITTPLWRRLLEAVPGDGEASLALGIASARSKSQDSATAKRAKRLLTRAYSVKGTRAQAALWLARLEQKAGDLKRAVEHFKVAAQAGLGGVGLHQALGQAAQAAGQQDEAIAHLQKVAEARPKDLKLALNLGGLLAAAGRHRLARPYLERALGGSRAADAELLLAKGYAAEGALAQAAAHYRKASGAGVESKGAQLLLGDTAAKSGKLKEARAAYERALVLDPRDGEAHFQLGLLLQKDHAYEQAAKQFAAARAAKVKPIESGYQLGRSYAALGKQAAAVGAFGALLKAKPGHQGATLQLGLLLAKQGKTRAARPLLEKARAARPGDSAVALALGKVLLAEGEAKAARPLLEQALGSKPNAKQAEVFLSVARQAAKEGRPAQSNRFLSAVLRTAPGDAAALLLRGRNHLALGEFGQAEAALKQALKATTTKPAESEVRYELARSFEAQGKRREAIEAYRLSFEAGGPIEAGVAYARALLDKQGVEAALAAADKVASREATPAALRLLAALRQAAGDRVGAAKAWKQLLESGVEDGDAHLFLAREAVAAGQMEAAKRHLEAARNHTPDRAAVCALSGRLAFRGGDFESARRDLSCALEASPGDRGLLLQLAESELSSGAAREAELHLRALLRVVPDHRRGHFLMARAQEALGHRSQALSHYRTFASLTATSAASRGELARTKHPLFLVAWEDALAAAATGEASASALAGSLQAGHAPTRAEAFLRMGLVHQRAGEGEAATRAFESALASAPGTFRPAYALGLSQLRQGRAQEAAEALRQAVDADPERLGARTALAAAYIASGRASEAEVVLRPALKRKGGHDQGAVLAAKLNSALLKAMSGDEAAALKALAALAAAPGSEGLGDTIAMDRAILELRAGHPEKAAKEARALLVRHPDEPRLHFILGKAALARGDAQVARAAFRSAVGAEPDFARARYELALLYSAAGEWQSAREALSRVTALDPEFAEAHARLGVVYGKLGHPAKELAEYRNAGQIMGRERLHKGNAEDLVSLGIVPFRALQPKGKKAWLSQGIAESLSTDLVQLGAIRLVERSRMDAIVQEISLSELGAVDPASAVELGEQLGAHFLLTGAFSIDKKIIQIDGRVLDLEDAEVVSSARVRGPVSKLIPLQRKLALTLIEQFVELSLAQKKAFLSMEEGSVGALQNLALGRSMLFAGRPEEAKAYLRKAMAEDPRYAQAAEELHSAWGEAATPLAILPLRNLSGRKEDAWLSQGIAESLSSDLAQVSGIFLVERMQINKAIGETAFGASLGLEDVPELQAKIGAGLLMLGSYQVTGGKIKVDARLVDASTGQVLLAEKVSGREEELFDLERQLAERIVSTLKVELTDEERSRLSEGKPSVADFRRMIAAQSRAGVVAEPEPVRRLLVSAFSGVREGKPDAELAEHCSNFFTQAFGQNRSPELISGKVRSKALALLSAARPMSVAAKASKGAKANKAGEATTKDESKPRDGGPDQAQAELRAFALARKLNPKVADAILVGRCIVDKKRIRVEARAIMSGTGNVRVSVGSDRLLGEAANLLRQSFEELLRGLGVERKLSDSQLLVIAGAEVKGVGLERGVSPDILAAKHPSPSRGRAMRRARWAMASSGIAALGAGALMFSASHFYATAEEAAGLRNSARSGLSFQHYDSESRRLQGQGDSLMAGGIGVGAVAVGLAGYAVWTLLGDGPLGLQDGPESQGLVPAIAIGVVPTPQGVNASAALQISLW